jgi:ribosomal protein L11 methyltransferase
LFSLLLRVDEQNQEIVIGDLWELGTMGIVQHSGALEAFFDNTADTEELLRRFASLLPRVIRQEETDWVRRTEESFPPQLIGNRFFLVPPWNHEAAPAGRLRLEINPGLACGTGWHPCTRLCLEAMERTIRAGDRVLDVGTGSGILSVAAALLGAGSVIGCDVDPEAVRIARDRIDNPLFVGSADAVVSNSVDVLVANISAEAARDLFAEFCRVARVIILSGFQSSPALSEQPEVTLESEGWLCLVAHNRKV